MELKWKKLRYFYWLQAVIFITESFLVTAFFFYPDNLGLFIALEILLFTTFLYEICSIALYAKKYFTSIQNNVDIIGNMAAIVLTFTLFMIPEYRDEETRVFRFFYVFLLGLLYFRSLLYLRAFKQLRHLIIMLYAITVDLFDIIFLFTFILICLAFMLTISNKDSPFKDSLFNTFVSMHGNFPDDNTKDFKDWILLVIISIFVSLIMANFMIARISNNYSALESFQHTLNFCELAEVIWELEVWYKALSSRRRASDASTDKSLFYFIGVYTKNSESQISETADKNSFENSLKQIAKGARKKIMTNSKSQQKILEQITNHFDKSQRILNEFTNQTQSAIPRRMITND